jgi:hypothetical protein
MRCVLGGLVVLILAAPGSAQIKDSLPSKPSVIGSTYAEPKSRHSNTETIHLYEEDRRLIRDTKSNGWEGSDSVRYEKVNYVMVDYLLDNFVLIKDSEGGALALILPTEEDAKALAQYVGRKAGLELIAGAWRVRKPFECPEAGRVGCRDFKELLDHDDPDIAEYVYEESKDNTTYACFSDESRRFFIVSYWHYLDVPNVNEGKFELKVLTEGQSNSFTIGIVHWYKLEGIGTIVENPLWVEAGKEPQTLGTIDSSSLSYSRQYTNRLGTKTQYELSVRWSTGRYTESFSAKDDKGKHIADDAAGICVKLN